MRIRQKRKVEKRRRAELHRVLDLCLDINGMQSSCRERTGNHPTAFLTLWGHTGTCDVEIYHMGWESGPESEEIAFKSSFASNVRIRGDITPGKMADELEGYFKEGSRKWK